MVQHAATGGEPYEKASTAWNDARKAYDRTYEAEQATKALDAIQPSAGELRDLSQAQGKDIPAASERELAEPKFDGVMIRGTDGRALAMPYARPGREGWVRNLPVAAQHASIIRRLPDDLLRVAALQNEAFTLYCRGGMKAFRNNEHLVRYLNDLQENSDTEGGYLVPTDQRVDILVPPGTPGGVMRSISSVFSTTRDGGTWPRLSTDITMAAVAEEAAFPESDPAFGQVPFTIHKVGRAVDLSVELLADSAVNVPSLLGARFTAARGRYEDQQGIEGDGTTEPLGLRTAGWATISDVTDLWTLAAPTAVELINNFYEMPAEYRDGSTWFMTSGAFSRVIQIGAAAAGIHLIDLMGSAVRPLLLGRPVVFFDGTGWDDAASIGANEELGALGNFGNYAFIDRVGMTVERDDSVAFRTDQVVFKARVRYDSLFLDANAFRILKAAAS
jgi:HK97 family phage major capsid protein